MIIDTTAHYWCLIMSHVAQVELMPMAIIELLHRQGWRTHCRMQQLEYGYDAKPYSKRTLPRSHS